MSYLVYLAGPIKGGSYWEATAWRRAASDYLSRESGRKVLGLSPMRGKVELANEERIADSYEDRALTSARGIVSRDWFDVRRADLLLANLLGSEELSLGTLVEIGWASAWGKPIIVCRDEGGPYDHPFIRELAACQTLSLQAALDLALAFLLPGAD